MGSVVMRGFSLVELSIVLVILGLLTSGILAGQSLIRAAELRAITTEHSRYITAVQTFRDKYFALPGDFNRAEDFWTAMTNCAAATPSGSGTQTCNGDGDGSVETDTASQTGEVFGFWQHLANAGLIEGTYDGIAGSGGADDAELGDNAPRSKLTNAGWHAEDRTETSSTDYYEYDYGNSLIFGEDTAAGETSAAALTPEEAWNLDTKMDDGLPARGKVIAIFWNDACAVADDGGSADNDYDASYVLTDTSSQCALIFPESF